MAHNKFLCMAFETTGVQSSAAIVEFGWILFRPERPDEGVGGVHLIDPGNAHWEPRAIEIHTQNGLGAALTAGPLTTLDAVWSEMLAALEADAKKHSARLWRVWWSGRMRHYVEDSPIQGVHTWGTADWDFTTVNSVRSAFTVNPLVGAATSRALPKLAAMRKCLTEWHALFNLADREV